MPNQWDLTGENIENTYQRVLQTPDGVNIYDGTGSLFTGSFTGSFYGTASWAYNSLTASYALVSSDILVYVKNQSGQNIAKGVVVRITGSNNSSDIPRVVTASYENDNNSANTLGITYQSIANGSEGYVATEGILTGINTNDFISGQLIYLGPTGSIIGYAPVAPLHAVRLGEVIRHQSNNGSIYVRIDNGYELDELHNVRINTASLSSGDLLVYSSSVWINAKQLTGSYGLTGSLNITGNSGSIIEVSSSNAALRITQLGTGEAIRVEDSTNPDITSFIVDSSGSVGVGQFGPTTFSAPLYPIHVIASGGADARLMFDGKQLGNGAANTNITLAADTSDKVASFDFLDRNSVAYNGTATYTGPTVRFLLDRSGSSAPLVTGGARNQFYIINGYPNSNTTFRNSGSLGTIATLNIGPTGIVSAPVSFIAPTLQGTTLYPNNDVNLNIRTRDGGVGNRDILFGTGNSGGTPFTRMTISASGDVYINTGSLGIGTINPRTKLHVISGSSSGASIQTSDTAVFESNANTYVSIYSPTASNAAIQFGSGGTGGDPLGAYIRWNQANNLMTLGTANDGDDINFVTGNETSSMYLKNNTGLGIGTTAPLYRLHVRNGVVTNSSTWGGSVGVFENSGSDAFISILSHTGYSSGLGFGSNIHRPSARLAWTHDLLNFSLSTNTGSAFLTFGTGQAAERMRITTDGLVGIGTTTPDSILHVHNATAGSVTALSGTTMTIENNSTNYLSMLAPDGNHSGIVFGSPSDSFGAYMRWRQTDGFLDISTADFGDYLRFGAGNSDFKAYVTSTGFGVNTLPTTVLDISGSSTFRGGMIVSGNLLPGGPYTNNTSSYNLGSPTQAWKDIYVGNGSIYLVSGSASSSLSYNNSILTINNASVSASSLETSGDIIVKGNAQFQNNITASNLPSSDDTFNLVINSSGGGVSQYSNNIKFFAGSDPAVSNTIKKLNKRVEYSGTIYRVYELAANVDIPGGTNTYVNFLGLVTNNSTNRYIPYSTKGLVQAADPTFIQVQSPLGVSALVYDETLLFAAPIDLMTVNYDDTLGAANEFYIFLIAVNTNNFACNVWVNYEFLIPETDTITFTN